MTKEMTEAAVMADIEEALTFSFNALAHEVINDLEEMGRRQDQTIAVWTGFYASSWKASPSPIAFKDDVLAYSPWDNIKRKSNPSGSPSGPWFRPGGGKNNLGETVPPPVFRRRHPIPRFNIKQTMYIANTADYTDIAFWRSQGIIPYAHTGVEAVMAKVFSDRSRVTFTQGIQS